MSWFDLIVLSVVQGIAEFLPISSSGHLVIVEALLGVESHLASVNIALHFGTLLSIVTFYWKRIWRLFSEDVRVIGLLIVGTIPAAAIGLTIKKLFPNALESPLLAGCMLPITGIVLLWSSKRSGGDKRYQELSWLSTLFIGFFQAFALLPGISRSGFTISAGLLTGQRKESAATFSFLLALPAILGATVLEAKDVAAANLEADLLIKLGVGVGLSFVVGLAALWWLVKLLEAGKLHWFAYWCIPLGIVVIVWQLFL